MKRYNIVFRKPVGSFTERADLLPSADGDYVLFPDAHAALKELAIKSLTFGFWHHMDCGINVLTVGRAELNIGDESLCTCGLREFRAQLKSLTEGPV